MIKNALTVMATGANITTSVASSNVAIPVASSGARPSNVCVSATVAARIRFGTSAGVTAIATDLLILPSGTGLVLSVPRGVTHIAAIQDTAAGMVAISPLEDD